ncbi:MAG: MBL fold metallo-hydrolase [Peptococcaceae bacterium]|nr:MBL fold metallo-hydrolase [Peptococcaceae bacterium]
MEITVLASGSKGNAHFITDGHTLLLLEAGITWREIQRGLSFKTSEIAGCLVTHEHQDHSKAIKDVMKAGIDCYLSRGTAEALGVAGHRIKIIRAREQFRVGAWAVMPFDTVHDAAEPVGFLLANQAGKKLLYITDTAYCRYRFRGLTHIMVECNYSMDILRANVDAGVVPVELKNRLLKSHMSLETVKEFLRANDLSRVEGIWLLHLSDGNSDAERFRREIMEFAGKPTYIT